jgi:hypothetical protein
MLRLFESVQRRSCALCRAREWVTWRSAILAAAVGAGVVAAYALLTPPLGFARASLDNYTYPFGDGPFLPSRWTTSGGGAAREGTYAPASKCGSCHVQQEAEWAPSLHSRSASERIYEAVEAMAERENTKEFLRWCNGCHTPVDVLEGRISPGLAQGDMAQTGVTCTICHTAGSILDTRGDASIVSAPDRVRAPFFWLSDGLSGRLAAMAVRLNERPHKESYLKDFHRTPEFCATCHQETNPLRQGFALQNTYEEWRTSPYNDADPKKRVTCQDCHMSSGVREKVAHPGTKVEGGTRYPHVAAHRFTGANTVVPMLYGDRELFAANERSLRAAAGVHLKAPGAAVAGTEVDIEVEVTNTGAGHNLPTGVEMRQMWVELAVTDSTGVLVHVAGDTDAQGEISSRAWMFGRRIADERGDEIRDHRIWRAARELSDTRIRPKQSARRTYRVPLRRAGPHTIRATLRYRNLPQDLMDKIYRGRKVLVPITDMADASATLHVRPAAAVMGTGPRPR